MCKTSAYLIDNDDYHDALYQYYEDHNIGDGRIFFDNLFQNTKWYDYDSIEDFIASYNLEDYIVENLDGRIDIEETLKCIENEWENHDILYTGKGLLLIM